MHPDNEVAFAPGNNNSDVGGGPYKVFYIVDGQQRMTTAVLLVSAVESVNPSLLPLMQIRNFLYDKEEGAFKFQTVPEDWPFLRALIDGDSDVPQTQTPSQERIKGAYKFFTDKVSQQNKFLVEKWIKNLSACLVLVHAVNGYGEASVIFETVNDRGKRLTDLEALKSFLMRIVDMTKQSDVAERQAIEALQSNFAAVYRMLNRFERDISENNALRQCYLVFPRIQVNGSTSSWDGNGNAKDDAKRWLLSLIHNGKQDLAFKAAHHLAHHIQTSFQKIEAVINNLSKLKEIEQLLTLRRIAGFWPIILKTYPDGADVIQGKKFRSVLRLCEIASLKTWGIADYRSDKAQSELTRLAQRDGNDRDKVISRLKEIMKWWDVPARWKDGLSRDTFYYQGRDARYCPAPIGWSGQNVSAASWLEAAVTRSARDGWAASACPAR